jgi:hypothetical protein
MAIKDLKINDKVKFSRIIAGAVQTFEGFIEKIEFIDFNLKFYINGVFFSGWIFPEDVISKLQPEITYREIPIELENKKLVPEIFKLELNFISAVEIDAPVTWCPDLHPFERRDAIFKINCHSITTINNLLKIENGKAYILEIKEKL